MKLIEKAYQIDFSKIEEGFLYSDRIVWADNRNQAKKLLLKDSWDMNIKGTNEEPTYLTIPVIRCKEADKFEFEGQSLTRMRIDEIVNRRLREKFLDDLVGDFFYIRKRGYYYAPNSCGYVSSETDAGVYKRKDAISHAKSCEELFLVPIDVETHNKNILDKIENLKRRLL